MLDSLDVVLTDLTPEYELYIGPQETRLHALPGARQFDHDRETTAGTE